METFLIITMVSISQFLDYFSTCFMGIKAEGNPIALWLFKNNLALPYKVALVVIMALMLVFTKRYKRIDRFYKLTLVGISLLFMAISMFNIYIGATHTILNWEF